MTVAELIEALKLLDPEMTVYIGLSGDPVEPFSRTVAFVGADSGEAVIR